VIKRSWLFSGLGYQTVLDTMRSWMPSLRRVADGLKYSNQSEIAIGLGYHAIVLAIGFWQIAIGMGRLDRRRR